MIYGYARVSTDGQSVDAQVRQLRAAGARQVFREVASGAKPDRSQLRRALDLLDPDDVLMVTKYSGPHIIARRYSYAPAGCARSDRCRCCCFGEIASPGAVRPLAEARWRRAPPPVRQVTRNQRPR